MTTVSGDYDIDLDDYELDDVPDVFAYIMDIATNVEIADSSSQKTAELQDQVDIHTLYLHSQDFLTLLSKIECEFDYDDLFNSTRELPEVLKNRGTQGYNNRTTYTSKLENTDLAKVCGLTAIALYYFKNDHHEKLEQVFNSNFDVLDSGRDEYLVMFIRSYLGYSILSDRRYGEISEPIVQAHRANQSGPKNSFLKLNLSVAIIEACELRFDYDPDVSGLPESRESILEFALEKAREAKQIYPNFTRIHTTLARGNSLLYEFDTAWRNLNEALINDQVGSSEAHLTEERLEQLQRNINSRYQAHSLEKEVGVAKDELEEVQVGLDSVKQNLENVLDRFRKNNLSFIGFFAALITLVVASVEIVSSGDSTVQESGRLLIMLSGGMLIAFGGFGLLLPKPDSSSQTLDTTDRRSLLLAILGGVLILLGYNPNFPTEILSAFLTYAV